MANEKLIPELRFPGFEGEGEWKKKRLNDLFSEFKSGNGITSENIRDKDQFPVYGGNGLRGYTDNYTHDGFYLLIGRQGALCGNINRSYGKAFISEHAIACKENKDSDLEWLAQRLDYYNLNRLSESSAQPGLSVAKLLRLKLIVPLKNEQQKIASFLTSVDKRISLLTQKKEKLEQYKKGVMQKIFNQEIRFKDDGNGKDNRKKFPEWEEFQFKELYEFKSTNSLSRENLNYEEGNVKNIHYGDIHTKFKTLFRIENENVPFINQNVNISRIPDENYLREGDLVIADASEDYTDIGKAIEIVNLNNEKVLAGLHTLLARRKKTNIASGFMGYLMKSEGFHLAVTKIAQGTKILSISSNRLNDLKVFIPCTKEQQKIATFLSALDKQIEQVDRLIVQTCEWKKGLLQKMFV